LHPFDQLVLVLRRPTTGSLEQVQELCHLCCAIFTKSVCCGLLAIPLVFAETLEQDAQTRDRRQQRREQSAGGPADEGMAKGTSGLGEALA
jgi:hypothetical protein